MKTQAKIITLALTIQMVASPLMAMAAFFPDSQNNWAKNAIQSLSDQGILTGYPDGSFRPQGLITRAEFSAMMVKALSLNLNATGSQTFNDVPTGHWAYPSIETVRATGLVSGYPNGQFMPAKSISRAESMAILSNAARIPMPSDATINQVLAGYRDAASIPTWARPGVAAAIQAGIFANEPNAGNAIEPLQPATRAEVAAMVENLRARMNLAGGQAPAATTPPTQAGTAPTTLQGRVSSVPAETKFTGTLSSGVISSELNKVGDMVNLKVDQPLMSSDNMVIIPTGSQIMGKVTEVQSAGRTGKPGTMDIAFTEIVTPDGQRYAIQGSVATEDGMLRGDTTKGRILKSAGVTAIGAGLGAALGTAMGPLSGGKVGKGAIYGTAVGAGAGALAAAAKKGKEVSISSGDKLEIKLDQPITVQVNTPQ
ncbi:S-layer homology domain-containing protein [Vampirovibrio sp.]|uniref:S-layer homology domain-containing protein n=1 Tax=Vampirovibrio sp. TaxID=2717857 RepID=UPI0035947402